MKQSDIDTRHYRTIPKVVMLIKEHDPDSAITEYGLRLAIKKDQIRHRNIGRRIVVDLDDVLDYYRGCLE